MGFTLIEVLAALLLIGIVLPALMSGLSLASNVASHAKKKTEAVGLAQAKLTELIVTGEWEDGTPSGDFGTDLPGYRWEAESAAWEGDTSTTDLTQVTVRVVWRGRGGDESVTLSTLARSSGL